MPTVAAKFELLGHAPTEAALWVWLKSLDWAWTVDGVDRTADGVQLDIIGPIKRWSPGADPLVDAPDVKDVGGVHFNLRFYGNLAGLLTSGVPTHDENGNPTNTIWDWTNIASTAGLANAPQTGDALSRVPAGKKDTPGGITLFDPNEVTQRSRVWA